MGDSCDVKRCREVADLGYYGFSVCWRHWTLHCDDAKPFNLKGALKIKKEKITAKPKPEHKTAEWVPGKKLL